VAFLHPLFQEYFAAEALRMELEATRDYAAVLGDRPFTGEWDEVVVMLAGVYSDPISLVKWLATEAAARQQGRAVLLVHHCWGTSDAMDDAEARTRVVDALIRALGDPDEDVRWRAVGALGRIGDARAVEPLIRALGDPDEDVRREAAFALGMIGNARAVEPLIGALDDPNEWVRRQAAWALGEIGDARALPELERVAREDTGKTPWGSVAEAAREAAERIRRRMGQSTDR